MNYKHQYTDGTPIHYPLGKVVCIGRNYADHAQELGNEVDAEPGLFLMPNTAVCGPGDPVFMPSIFSEISYEGELAVIIGRMCKDIAPEDVPGVVLGYTCANDVTARDLQKSDVQFTRGKGFDTFCPLGPWIETDLDPAASRVTTRLDGEVVQTQLARQLVEVGRRLTTVIDTLGLDGSASAAAVACQVSFHALGRALLTATYSVPGAHAPFITEESHA